MISSQKGINMAINKIKEKRVKPHNMKNKEFAITYGENYVPDDATIDEKLDLLIDELYVFLKYFSVERRRQALIDLNDGNIDKQLLDFILDEIANKERERLALNSQNELGQ